METNAVIAGLVAAYRQADTEFAAAQAGSNETRQNAFARIIGGLQGEIALALSALGYEGTARVKP